MQFEAVMTRERVFAGDCNEDTIYRAAAVFEQTDDWTADS